MKTNAYDLTVVGGGVMGAACVWQAKRLHREWSIAWLEQNGFGSGCTGKSGGLLLPLGASPSLRELAMRSQAQLAEVETQIGPVRTELDAFVVAPPAIHEQRKGWYINRIPLAAALPSGLGEFVRMPFGEYAAGPWPIFRVAPPVLVARMLAHLRRHGIRGEEGARVSAFSKEKNAIALTCSRLGTLRTRKLIFTTGPWLPPAPAVIPRVKRVAALHFAGPVEPGAIAIAFPKHQAFLIPDKDRERWLLSFRSEEWDVSPDRTPNERTAEDDRAVLPALDDYLPLWRDGIIGGQASCDTYPEERDPVVQVVQDDASILYVGGSSGSGVRIAFALAEDAIEKLLKGRLSDGKTE